MHDGSSKHQGKQDKNEWAFRVFQKAIVETWSTHEKEKNPAAVELGRLEGRRAVMLELLN
jgi:hypothetical protein